jgi:hypothetical protein
MSWVGIGVGIGGLTAVKGIFDSGKAAKEKKRLAKEAAAMKDPALTNVADGMQVSMRGADLKTEQQARLAATQVNTLSEGGTRSLVSGIGRVAAGNQSVNEGIAANLDEQETNIQNIRAQDEGRMQMTKEQRQQAKLAALSSQYNAASDAGAQAMGNIIQGAGMAAGSAAAGFGGGTTGKGTGTSAAATRGAASRQFGKGAKLR